MSYISNSLHLVAFSLTNFTLFHLLSVDIIGVVQSVSPTLSIRRKIDNESIPKRDIVVADDS